MNLVSRKDTHDLAAHPRIIYFKLTSSMRRVDKHHWKSQMWLRNRLRSIAYRWKESDPWWGFKTECLRCPRSESREYEKDVRLDEMHSTKDRIYLCSAQEQSKASVQQSHHFSARSLDFLASETQKLDKLVFLWSIRSRTYCADIMIPHTQYTLLLSLVIRPITRELAYDRYFETEEGVWVGICMPSMISKRSVHGMLPQESHCTEVDNE